AQIHVRGRWLPTGEEPAQMRQVERRAVERHDHLPARRPAGKLVQVAPADERARPLGIEDADHRHLLGRLHVDEPSPIEQVGQEAPVLRLRQGMREELQLADLDPDAQLLPQLPGQRGALPFARLHLAAGELPQAGPFALFLPAGHQHLAAALDQRCHDEHPAVHGSSPREKSTPALETTNAAPRTTSAGPENPEPGSKAPRVRPVTASTAMSGPRSSATSTSPPITDAAVEYRSFPSGSFQRTLPSPRASASSAPFPLAYTRGPSTITW